MKYEMIFGDYNFANCTCEIAMQSDHGEVIEMTLTAPVVVPEGWRMIAMRRIIKEPKRWAWEDKKAGRLPEVLGKVTTYDGKPYSFVGESCHDNQWSLKDDATGKVYHTPIGDILPIETPAEKARREEDEFVTSITKCTYTDGYSSGYIEGLRAAYRKLKGGE